MTPIYTYTPSADFIQKLSFEYLETYSFQRGIEYEANLKIIWSEYENLKARKEKRDDLSELESNRFEVLHQLLGFTQYLVNENGVFHPSSRKINTFQHADTVVSKLINILHTEVIDIPLFMCAPMYRDAIVFYDKSHKIISILNICLSCQYMETSRFNHIQGDFATYDLLKRFFLEIGHQVENPTHFILDDLRSLKDRYQK